MASLKVVKVEIEDQRGMPQISQTGQPHVFISASGAGEAAKDLLSRHPEQPMGVGGGDHPWAGPRNSENPITLPPSEYGT